MRRPRPTRAAGRTVTHLASASRRLSHATPATPLRAGIVGAIVLAVATTGTATVITSSVSDPTPSSTVVAAPSGAQTIVAATVPSPTPVTVAPFTRRVRADLLVSSTSPLAAPAVRALADSAPTGAVTVRRGSVKIGDITLGVLGVDPGSFRAFAPEGTAESDAVWQSVANGDIAVSHQAASSYALALGSTLAVTAPGGPLPLRFGALASTGLPHADLVVSNAVADALGLPAATALLLSAGGKDPAEIADAATKAVAGIADVTIDLLTAPAASPVAFLSGSKAAEAFGSFSYRYFPDGVIAPDDAWVRANIRTETVPLLGRVTCHRLMLPQLRGALQEISDAGLGSTLHTYDGCYVPAFIDRDTKRSISLHTWGIAIDIDAATNYRGIAGTMDPRVVTIFKKWGFRWGGDWSYTDPMHFELGALIQR